MFIKTKFLKLNSYIFFLTLILFIILMDITKLEARIFKIENVEVSEPFNSNFNKDITINKAFVSAFEELTSTLITSKDKVKLASINLDEIKLLVESFEISDESFLNKNYIAKFNVNFNKKNTLSFFEQKNIFPSLKNRKDFLTILIFINNDNNEISIYENNPFHKYWNEDKKKFFLLNYVLTEEDIDTLKAINDNKENIEKFEFENIIKKYDLKDYIIGIFFKNDNKIRFFARFYFNDKLKILNTNYGNITSLNEGLVKKIISEIKIKFEDTWKKNNQINTSIKLPINLQISSKKNKEFLNLENKMDEIDLISNYYITSLNNELINLKIIFNGSPKQFLNLMNSNGIKIDTDNEIWKVK